MCVLVFPVSELAVSSVVLVSGQGRDSTQGAGDIAGAVSLTLQPAATNHRIYYLAGAYEPPVEAYSIHTDGSDLTFNYTYTEMVVRRNIHLLFYNVMHYRKAWTNNY